MSTASKVRAARSPQEALLFIAEALDRIEGAQRTQPPDPWVEWADSKPMALAAATPDEDLDDMDPGERAAVLEARSRLAQDKPGQHVDRARPEGVAVKSIVSDDEIVVELPPASAEKKAKRLEFERQWLKLGVRFKQDGLDEAYAKGGPMWLYLSGPEGRDHILSLPLTVRQQMVADVHEDSPAQAFDLGRDLLKARSEEEITSVQRVTEGYLRG